MATSIRPRAFAARAAATLLAGLLLAGLALLATPRRADAAPCPPGTVALGILCLRAPTPAPTAPPQTTTTAPPLVNLPPVTLPPVAPPPAAPVSAPDAAGRLLAMVNAERAKAGLGALTSRADVVAIAQAHSERMAQAGDIFHSDSFFSASVKNLLNAVTRGENVAYNGDIDAAHARLMASAGHRANILDRSFSVVGIGVVRHADGRYFITQDFIQPAGAPRAAAAAPAPRAAPKPAAAKPAAAPRPAPAPTTTTAPAPTVPPAPPIPEAVPAPEATLSLADAAPAVIAATGTPQRGLGATVPLLALGLLAVVSAGCWLVPRRS